MSEENENTNLDGQENEEVDPNEEIEIEEDLNSESEETDESGDETSEEDTSEIDGKKEGKVDPVQKRINKIHREKKEAEESAAAEKTKRIAIEKKLEEATKTELPEIPLVPDVLDPEYDAKMGQRDKVIVAHARAAANEEALQQSKLKGMQDSQKAHAERVTTAVSSSYETAATLQIDKESFNKSQDTVGGYLTGKPELAMYLLEDADGPLNITYLSQNLAELDKISKMSETKAAVYIATKVTPQAKKLKPKQSKTPKPPYAPKGRARTKGEDPNLEGCTFT